MQASSCLALKNRGSIRRIRANHQTLHRANEIAVCGLRCSALIFPGIAVEVRAPLFVGWVQMRLLECNELSPRQRECVAGVGSGTGRSLSVHLFCDILAFWSCLNSLRGFGMPPDGAIQSSLLGVELGGQPVLGLATDLMETGDIVMTCQQTAGPVASALTAASIRARPRRKTTHNG